MGAAFLVFVDVVLIFPGGLGLFASLLMAAISWFSALIKLFRSKCQAKMLFAKGGGLYSRHGFDLRSVPLQQMGGPKKFTYHH